MVIIISAIFTYMLLFSVTSSVNFSYKIQLFHSAVIKSNLLAATHDVILGVLKKRGELWKWRIDSIRTSNVDNEII